MTEVSPRARWRAGGFWTALAIVLVSVNLRPAVVAISPLLPELRAETGLSAAAAGLLTAIPVLCFGALSPFAPRVARHFGLEQTIFAAVVVLCAGLALRLLPDLVSLFTGTALAGAAIAFCNVLMPALIKRDFAGRMGLMTGVYSMAITGGAAIAAGLTIPIGKAADLDWRFTLGSWGLLALAALLVWLPQLRQRHTVQERRPSPRIWRDRLAWAVTLYFGIQCLLFYGLTAWLPEVFIGRGMTPLNAGLLLSLANVTSISTALLGPLLAARMRRQRSLALGTTVIGTVALAGVIWLPAASLLWMPMLGLCQGALLSLGFAFFVLRTPDAAHAAELSGMAQSAGYLIAASGPFLVGVIHDLTANWTAALGLMLALMIPQGITGWISGRDSLVGAKRPSTVRGSGP